MPQDNNIEEIAAQVALAFQTAREKVILHRHLDDNGNPLNRFPRYTEEIQPKTLEEIAESNATVTFLNPLGLISERPLTFLEIFEKMKEMGFSIQPTGELSEGEA